MGLGLYRFFVCKYGYRVNDQAVINFGGVFS